MAWSMLRTICSDMQHAQTKLHQIHYLTRAWRESATPSLREQMRHACVSQSLEVARCAAMLCVNFNAANDERGAPEAA
jgi:hypothetical protein